MDTKTLSMCYLARGMAVVVVVVRIRVLILI